MRNVEIKAHVSDLASITRSTAALSGNDGQILIQEDTFFNTEKGRLKLRQYSDQPSQLIYYERPDQEGPKTSNYDISEVTDPATMKTVLSRAFGMKGVVKKKRLLHMVGQTRVHLDEVEGLGSFMELEVILSPEETSEDGEKIAEDLMEKLGVTEEDLITVAYMDLILKKQSVSADNTIGTEKISDSKTNGSGDAPDS